ncbi:DUF4870 domain-containing protein [Carboxylicivirga taeanensis]|uniref:DUF4870 domain-containing protein n=1 Tax=Carboxylicivirga taeanensis TaxID=1416875 RepID=UPI003F6DBE63
MNNTELQKRVKELRTSKGMSQENLAEQSKLSVRTIQRIENGETVPRGDTLKRLAVSLQVSPDDIIDWKTIEDKNVITMLNLSQLGFLVFPLLGIIIPLAIWMLKKEKIRDVDTTGKAIINFQISWIILLFAFYSLLGISFLFHVVLIPLPFPAIIFVVVGLYVFNLIMIFSNSNYYHQKQKVKYIPALRILK